MTHQNLLQHQCLSDTEAPPIPVRSRPQKTHGIYKMTSTRKTRIPSVPYLEQKIAQIAAIVNPTSAEIVLLAQYKKLLGQRMP